MRQRLLERRVERRYPQLYDMRHALHGFGRLLLPLIGPLIAALILLPLVVGLVWLTSLLGLRLPAFDMPGIPMPNVTLPGWIRAIGDTAEALFSVLATVAKYLVPVLAVIIGVRRTREVRRRRAVAEQLGRSELLRRLAAVLRNVEARRSRG